MTRRITASEVRLARLFRDQAVLSITIVVALATGVGLATVGFILHDAVLHGSLTGSNQPMIDATNLGRARDSSVICSDQLS